MRLKVRSISYPSSKTDISNLIILFIPSIFKMLNGRKLTLDLLHLYSLGYTDKDMCLLFFFAFWLFLALFFVVVGIIPIIVSARISPNVHCWQVNFWARDIGLVIYGDSVSRSESDEYFDYVFFRFRFCFVSGVNVNLFEILTRLMILSLNRLSMRIK